MAAKKKEEEISIVEIRKETINVCLLGRTPFICNAMSQKVRQELLLPKGRKTAADKRTTLKHDPLTEFRNSPYKLDSPDAPTLIAMLSTAFKRSLASAAVDIPGATRAQIGRLCWVKGEKIPMFGVPKLFMSVTRSADMNRTPDIRTRAILPEWAAMLEIEFVIPLLNRTNVVSLLSAAGLIQGVGDWRPEKGSGNYGGNWRW
jgi:hypothetical protein